MPDPREPRQENRRDEDEPRDDASQPDEERDERESPQTSMNPDAQPS